MPGLITPLLLASAMVASPSHTDSADTPTFRITPVHPISELLAAKPPLEHRRFRPPELIEPARLDPRIRLDIRYAGNNNFLGQPLYDQAWAFLQRPTAEALFKVQQALAKDGYGLIIYDAYRPWYVSWLFWAATPTAQHRFVADPAEGSRHNRGCAVDLGLYQLDSGQIVPMPSGFDEMTERAYPDLPAAIPKRGACAMICAGRWRLVVFEFIPPNGGTTTTTIGTNTRY